MSLHRDNMDRAEAKSRLSLSGIVLGSPDPLALARFYERLLGWEMKPGGDETWVQLLGPSGPPALSFQLEVDHVPPAWPAGPGDQQMQMHLDIRVDDLDAAAAHAEACGATPAQYQPQEDVRVYIDPVGHPFCLALE